MKTETAGTVLEGNRTVPVVIGDCVMWTMIPSSFCWIVTWIPSSFCDYIKIIPSSFCKSYGKIPSFFCTALYFSRKWHILIRGKAKGVWAVMVYLKRKIDTFLIEWKNDLLRKPLVVKGPRQVGKTESIRRFGEQNYECMVEINFVEEPKYRMITADGYKTADLVRNISRMDPTKKFVEGKTLLFFDELQEFPEIATALKFFAQDGRFDVICSGSMLGIHYGRIESNSVGYKTDYTMHSLDFEEFLWAKGYEESVADELLDHMREEKRFNEAQMSVYGGLFLDYCILGGMPAVVREYIIKDSFEGSLAIQRQLLADYEEDVRKYAEGMDQTRILNVFRQIPVQLSKDNKKFQYKVVQKGGSAALFGASIEWLNLAGVVLKCQRISQAYEPIAVYADLSAFKLYMGDVGLLTMKSGISQQTVLSGEGNTFMGAVTENYVAQQLVVKGYDLYYWESGSAAELDFVLQKDNQIIGIEVKKGEHVRSRSLNVFVSNYKPDYSIRLSLKNFGEKELLRSIPLYAVFCI